MIRKLAIFVIDITVSVKIPHPNVLVRFSRTVTPLCVVVTGPLFSPATHVGWSAPCRFVYKVITRGLNTRSLILPHCDVSTRYNTWHCVSEVWPCIDMLGIYVFIISIYLTLCICWLEASIPGALMSSKVLHGVPSAPYCRTCLATILLQSNCAFRFLSLSFCLADFWLAQGLIQGFTGSYMNCDVVRFKYVSIFKACKASWVVNVGICRH